MFFISSFESYLQTYDLLQVSLYFTCYLFCDTHAHVSRYELGTNIVFFGVSMVTIYLDELVHRFSLLHHGS